MVLQKRLDYSFQFPPTPRAARSARKRRFFKKTHEDSRVRAFDLLAILAGNLLLGNEPTSRSDNSLANQDQCQNTVKQEIPDGENPPNVEAHNQESPSRSFFVSDIVTQVQDQNLSPKESVNHHNDLNSVLASAVTSELQETSNRTKLVIDASKDETEAIACMVEAGSSSHEECSEFRLGGEIKGERKHEDREYRMVQNGAVADLFTLKHPVLGNKKHPAPVSLDTCPRVPLYGNRLTRSSYSANRGDVDIFSRDDDENSSGCTYPRSAKKYFRSALCMRDRRIRKISAFRYRKLAPRLKDATHSTIDLLKPVYHHRKNVYKIQRSEKIYPFKKRKYFQCSSPSNSDGGINSDFVAHSRQKGGHGDVSSCCQKHEATRASSSITAENTSCQPRDSHVKLRIKSFRVPELFIEVPQSATVGSLKRTVMEAVAAVLGGGLRVGVLLHGKKVRDDNKTLLQTGISHNNQLDAVGFSLEPNHSRNFPSLYGGGSPMPPSCDSCQPLSRYPPLAGVVHHETCVPPPEPQVNNIAMVESDHDSAPSPVAVSMEDKSTNNSKVLVAIPAINVEALAMVPAHRQNKGSGVVQRRIRRPFSVAEVEALVQAVEKIGTGRWRDVKMRAFDNAKHRTYVDLKDKWKTLVHTAKISPQQRRGEPVPQELLDRVLTAHAHWSQPHAKQQQQGNHPNPPVPETCLLLQGPSNNSNWAVGGDGCLD